MVRPSHAHTNTHSCVHCRSIYAYGMYINTYIVFCCCCCCETSRVSSSSLSVLAPPSLPSSPPPISRLLLILVPALLANSLWRRKTAAWHLLRFSVVDFCYFNVLGFPFSFPLLSFPLLCSALLGIASRSYLFPLPSARIMKTSSTKVVWVILLAASPVRLFGCSAVWSKWKAFLCYFL